MTSRCIKLVAKKEFIVAALDLQHEIFVFCIEYFSSIPLNADVHLFCKPQISSLIAKEAFIKVFDKYVNFTNVFSPDLAFKLSEHIKINNHAIELVYGQQLLYRPIYSLGLVELETLNGYIEINLTNRFIRLSESSKNASIIFDRKSDGFFILYVNYRDFNNLMMKNRYPLPLVEESFERLGEAMRFITLKFTSRSYQMRIRKEDKWKTIFRTRYSYFKYQVRLVELTNALTSL